MSILEKKVKDNPDSIWKKMSIFWDLPYWSYLDVWHYLELMYIVNNICESPVGLLLNIQGKRKDGVKVRKEMVQMEIRPELSTTGGWKINLSTFNVLYFVKQDKISLLDCIKSIKVSSDHFSNSKNLSIKELKLIDMKSYDCHVLLTQLLPIVIRRNFPPKCWALYHQAKFLIQLDLLQNDRSQNTRWFTYGGHFDSLRAWNLLFAHIFWCYGAINSTHG